MRQLFFAAIATLVMAFGNVALAGAAQPQTNHLGQVIWGPDYANDAGHG